MIFELDTKAPVLYQKAKPFPHHVFHNFFDPWLLKRVADSVPGPTDAKWWKYDNALEKKLAKDDFESFPRPIQTLIQNLNTPHFLAFLERLTGIQGLIEDPKLNGGGLHQILPGGKLDIHADYNYHPVTKLDRRLNVIVYLNEGWKEEWGGHLELWDQDMTECQVKIPPKFNTMVVFSTTDTSYHGHPDPLQCPEGHSRKSIALYYYTNGRPEHERSSPHSTIFKRRPQDDPALDALREERAKGRKGHLTT